MKILVTGTAGFIGYHLTKSLIQNKKNIVFGIDNLNSYYDINLKKKRLNLLKKYKNFHFKKLDLAYSEDLKKFFKEKNFDIIFHLAAQAGVRYSKKNPDSYIQSNILGFYNLLESIKNKKIKKFIYASSSSVYSEKNKKSFDEDKSFLEPNSLYALTKITNEEFGKFYSKEIKIPFICLRFFTVYGPMGRPDMAYSIFKEKIIKNEKIILYNNGNNLRDMTYIDDVVNIMIRLSKKFFLKKHYIFNIGRESPISNFKLMRIIENNLKIKAKYQFVKRDKIEVLKTFSNTSKIKNFLKYKKFVDIKLGISKFIKSL